MGLFAMWAAMRSGDGFGRRPHAQLIAEDWSGRNAQGDRMPKPVERWTFWIAVAVLVLTIISFLRTLIEKLT